MEPTRLLTHSLTDPRVARILSAALEAVEPAAAVRRYLEANPLPEARRVFALGLGKAAIPMSAALHRWMHLSGALAITKHASGSVPGSATIMEAGHPVPDGSSLAAGEAALEFASGLNEDDLLVCLISGGGSALVTAPLIPLEEMGQLTSALLACGARVDEINTIRRHLDRVKGGGIARATKARVFSLILSDVVGSPLEAIASGPTAPDPSTRWDALEIMRKYDLSIPASVRETLSSSPETPKPDDPIFSRVRNVIVGDNTRAAKAALAEAEREGFHTEYLGSHWQGEARDLGVKLAGKLLDVHTRPFCWVAGGETTVTLMGHGAGGRNQELALAAVAALDGVPDAMLISLATDGEDGPTDAAGAVVTGETLARAKALGLDPAEYLSRNDAYHFFERLDDLIKTGPTRTNVNDLILLFST
jgi:hydroxypyruvate reductase